MSQELSVKEYEDKQAVCEECKIAPNKKEQQTGEMPCVCCPFCKQIVTAILTESTISCPKCLVTVKRF